MRTDFSAGGVVTDGAGRVALIRTTSLSGDAVWGLPKGHPKKGESPEVTAVRETEEETGLRVELEASAPTAAIDYSFEDKRGELVNKRVVFYRMTAVGGDTAHHDAEVHEAILLPPSEARQRLTYDNERAVLDELLA